MVQMDKVRQGYILTAE